MNRVPHTVVARTARQGQRLTVTLHDLADGPDLPLGRAVVEVATGGDATLTAFDLDPAAAALGARLLTQCADEARARGCRRLLMGDHVVADGWGPVATEIDLDR